MNTRELLSIALGLVLAGAGIAFAKYSQVGYALMGLGLIACIAIPALLLLHSLPRVVLAREDAEKIATDIYKEAARNGGWLVATHIRPYAVDAKDDFALAHLARVDKPLEYRRFLYIEDRQKEMEWVNNTLSRLGDNVTVSVHTIPTMPLLPTSIWRVLPRANLLLYKRDNRYIAFLGLDRLLTQDPKFRNANLGILLRSRAAFDILSRYFHALVANKPYISEDRTPDEYARDHSDLISFAPTQSVLLSVAQFCEADTTQDVLHCGVFGRKALECAGVTSPVRSQMHEADVDVMLIVAPGAKERIRSRLASHLKEHQKLSLVWGDDDDYFYHYRDPSVLTLDCELMEKDTTFYVDHPLLGHSVFAFYLSLFRRTSDSTACDLIPLPKHRTTRKERADCLLNDRKGLIDFRDRLTHDTDMVDPRRIVAQTLKNLAWVISGTRVHDPQTAIEAIRSDKDSVSILATLNRLNDLLKRDHASTRAQHTKLMTEARDFVQQTIMMVGLWK